MECKFGDYRVNDPVYNELIETLWNVNELCIVLYSVALYRINRNIVECKFVSPMFFASFHARINRNIVECKWQLAAKINRILRQELIETLWNVNVEIVEARLFNSWN